MSSSAVRSSCSCDGQGDFIVAQFTVIQTPSGKWVVIDLPDDYREGAPFPPPQVTDPHFDTKAEATAELIRRIDAAAR